MTNLDDTLRRALDPVSDTWGTRPGLRPAAVLIPIREVEAADTLILTLRPESMPNHPGQVAFPGGRREGDESPVECALRETEEELGLPTSAIELLGALPPRVSNTGFFVNVVVGRVEPSAELRPDPREVDAVFFTSFERLADEASWDWRPVDGVRQPLPHFPLERGILWGLTARLTFDLIERTKAE